MSKKKTDDLHYWVLLSIIMSLCCVGFIVLRGNRDVQFLLGCITAMMYVVWGYVYHIVKGDLYPKTMVEYAAIAGIGIFLLATVLYI